MEKIKGFQEFINESIDIYTMDELESKGVYIEIKEESPKSLRVLFSVSGYYYMVLALPTEVPFVAFGNSDDFGENIELEELLNRDISRFALSVVFSVLRYWTDKFGVKEFNYMVKNDGIRQPLYRYYLDKHFPDFSISIKRIEEEDKLEVNLSKV